ncbi:MAG: hypothetical protein ACFFCW_27950 [Candidatus Hodarchaeota archaeon]
MIKRISCKVIRTIPLSKSIDELHYTNRSSDKSDNIKNATSPPNTNKCVWETSTNPRVQDFGKSVVYTHRMNITRIPMDNGLTALKLNCYA